MKLKILVLITGIVLFGMGALSVWIIMKEGSPVESGRMFNRHKSAPKPHKH